ncbi:MAG: GNAT family N-acetyltransferase [Alphaproteobacteria bacterium]
MAQHTEYMELGGYRGPSGELIDALYRHGNATAGLRLLIAEHAGTPVAGVLLANQGKAATYLMGWTGDDGRDLRATHLPLWRAIELLKGDGFEGFDLGGISAKAPGVERFKSGLGGTEAWLIGGYV